MGEREVAVKVMKTWGTKLEPKQERELELMRGLECEYIVRLYGTSLVNGRMGLVMELLPMGSLESTMKKSVFTPELKMRYAKDMCVGMEYLHSQHIIHRDLKLANVLVVSTDPNSSTAVCKISDFGTAKEVDLSMSMSMTMTQTANMGTPLYMAPEVFDAKSKYSLAADVYSYGITLAGLWNQQEPYEGQGITSMMQLMSAVKKGVRPSIRPDCPQPYIQLMSACWATDPHTRPTFKQIHESVFQ